jgi:hypothetical protein
MEIPYKKIVLFFLILIAILFLMNLWMDKEIYPHWPLQYEEAFSPKVNADVILMGASHTTHGVNPKYLEKGPLRVFNFAYNGASPAFNLKWYKKVFEPNYRKPRGVIYGVHWIMFDDRYLQRRFEQDSKYFPFELFLEEFQDLKSLGTLVLNRFAFIRERKQILPRIFRKKREREVYPVSQYYHGYIPFEARRDLDKRDAVNPHVDPKQVKAFEELLDEFKREEIPVIFVMIPDYIPGRDSATIQKSMELIRKIAEDRKIPLLDYENDRVTEINYNRNYYVDWAHLNGKGSEAFSKLLRDDFEAKGLFDLFSKAHPPAYRSSVETVLK